MIFETSAITDFIGQERDPHEYLDYVHLDVSYLDDGRWWGRVTVPSIVSTVHTHWAYWADYFTG